MEREVDSTSSSVFGSTMPSGVHVTSAVAQVDVVIGLVHRLVWWVVNDATALLGVAFLDQLRRILATGDDPFVEENARRLSVMARVAVAFAAVSMVRGFYAVVIQTTAEFDEPGGSFSFGSLALAFVLFQLIGFWRRGIALRTESELTI